MNRRRARQRESAAESARRVNISAAASAAAARCLTHSLSRSPGLHCFAVVVENGPSAATRTNLLAPIGWLCGLCVSLYLALSLYLSCYHKTNRYKWLWECGRKRVESGGR